MVWVYLICDIRLGRKKRETASPIGFWDRWDIVTLYLYVLYHVRTGLICPPRLPS